MELPVHFSTNEVIIVTFLGEGIIADDKMMLESGAESQNIPEHSVLVLPDQVIQKIIYIVHSLTYYHNIS